jgi:PTB domain (IRS-1 type)
MKQVVITLIKHRLFVKISATLYIVVLCNRDRLLGAFELLFERLRLSRIHYLGSVVFSETFLTELWPNNILVNVWYCFLQLCSDSVKLLDLDGVTCLVMWSFSCIRNYSYSHYQFVIETGR